MYLIYMWGGLIYFTIPHLHPLQVLKRFSSFLINDCCMRACLLRNFLSICISVCTYYIRIEETCNYYINEFDLRKEQSPIFSLEKKYYLGSEIRFFSLSASFPFIFFMLDLEIIYVYVCVGLIYSIALFSYMFHSQQV